MSEGSLSTLLESQGRILDVAPIFSAWGVSLYYILIIGSIRFGITNGDHFN